MTESKAFRPAGEAARTLRSPQSLDRQARLRRPTEFQKVFGRGRRAASRHLVGVGLPGGPARLGVVASRRAGGAVVRTRAKRRLRELYRRAPERFAGDLVLIARRGIDTAPWPELVAAYSSVLRRLIRSTGPGVARRPARASDPKSGRGSGPKSARPPDPKPGGKSGPTFAS